MSEVFSLMQQEYLWQTLRDVGNMVKTVLPEGSEQLKRLDCKISTFDQHQLSWPTEVINCLLKLKVPVYDQEAIIAINSTHGSDLDIVRKSKENRIRQLEEEQKRASVAIIKAREIRQKNWTD